MIFVKKSKFHDEGGPDTVVLPTDNCKKRIIPNLGHFSRFQSVNVNSVSKEEEIKYKL